MASDKSTDERVAEIVKLVNDLQDNDAALWSSVTHIIFADFNLSHLIIHQARENGALWLPLIKEQYDYNWWNGNQRILDVAIVIKALDKLMEYSEVELEKASAILWKEE